MSQQLCHFLIFKPIQLAAIAMVLCCVTAQAETISYDNGVLDVSYSGASWGKYFANRFTNTSPESVLIDAVLIRRAPGTTGQSVDVFFWNDDSGTPGLQIAGPVFSGLSGTWQSIDVSSLSLSLPSGGSIFAGFDPRGSTHIPFDFANPGAGRSWVFDTNDTWVPGGPGSENSNLMVRLEVSPVPEPSTLVLLAAGTVFLSSKVLYQRRRRTRLL